jgi:hypothetical protein
MGSLILLFALQFHSLLALSELEYHLPVSRLAFRESYSFSHTYTSNSYRNAPQSMHVCIYLPLQYQRWYIMLAQIQSCLSLRFFTQPQLQSNPLLKQCPSMHLELAISTMTNAASSSAAHYRLRSRHQRHRQVHEGLRHQIRNLRLRVRLVLVLVLEIVRNATWMWVQYILKYLIAPGHKSSVNAIARSSPSGKISKLMPTASSSSSSDSPLSLAGGDVVLLACLAFLFSLSAADASALSTALILRPMKPNQAKKDRPPIPVLSIFFLSAFCSGDNPAFDMFDFSAATTISRSPPVKSLSFFQLIGTGSETNPVQPSFDLRCQNFFSRTLSSKYSFGENSNRIETDLGSPLGLPTSKCETERFVRELSSSAESDGWMY